VVGGIRLIGSDDGDGIFGGRGGGDKGEGVRTRYRD
jgi:hypothetical protein